MITYLASAHTVSDGSLVLRANAGRQITVPPPFGVTLIPKNDLDSHNNIKDKKKISQVTVGAISGDTLSSLTFSNNYPDKNFAVGDIVFIGVTDSEIRDTTQPLRGPVDISSQYYDPSFIKSLSPDKVNHGLTTDIDGTTITFDISNKDCHIVTLGGNRTLAVTNEMIGVPFRILLKQDGTGSRTVTWWSGIKWAGGSAPTLTTTATKIDVFRFLKIAANSYIGSVEAANC